MDVVGSSHSAHHRNRAGNVAVPLVVHYRGMRLVLFLLSLYLGAEEGSPDGFVFPLTILAVAVAGNALFLGATRVTLRALALRPTLAGAIVLLTVSATFLGLVLLSYFQTASVEQFLGPLRGMEVGLYLGFLPFALLPSLMIGATFVLFCILLLTHRLVWPLLNRPLYALVRHRVIGRKPTLVAIGTAFLAVAWPPAGEAVKSLVSWFG